MTNYATLFQTQIQRSVAAALGQWQARQADAQTTDLHALTLHVLAFALPISQAWDGTRALVMTAAPQMEQASLWDEWLPLLETALRHSQAQGDIPAQAELHFHRGVIAQIRSDYPAADEALGQSADLSRAIGDGEKAGRALNRRAYVTRLRQQPVVAQRLIDEALSLLPPAAEERAYSAFVLGALAFDQQDWPAAEEHLRQALTRWRQAANPRMEARSLSNLGPVLQWRQKYDEALACYQDAEALLLELSDPLQLALTRMNMGIIHSLTGDDEAALDRYRQAEESFRRAEATLHLAQLGTNLGISYRRLGRWEEARHAYGESIALYRALEIWPRLGNALDGLGLTWLGEGNPAQAESTFREGLAVMERCGDDRTSQLIRSDLRQHLDELLTAGAGR